MEDIDDSDDVQRSKEFSIQTTEDDGIMRDDTTRTVNQSELPPVVDAFETNVDDDEELRLDYELQIIRHMRSTFVSTLHLLEGVRDDLNQSISRDVDDLRRASQQVRAALAKLREQIQ